MSGIQQGLSLYSPDQDIKLYKPLDFKPLDNVNFNDINKKLDENDNLYNNAKSVVSGGLNGILSDAGSNLNSFLSNLLGIDQSKVYTYLGMFILSLIILKKL